ncbi:MAG: DNA-binding NarL/FixJ family response regulator [Cyclobacteriaceae bacterium]|jgi:DNA-binding NarL/FixJ family response regulator
MTKTYKCLTIDDDPLFLRTLAFYIENIGWLELIGKYSNPILGAKAILKSKPDIVFLDMEMPHVDGSYLIDWIGPSLSKMDTPPIIIIISSLVIPAESQLPMVNGYINKTHVTSADQLAYHIQAILE